MTRFVGLDVSQKLTSICVVDETGRRLWRGQCSTDPEQLERMVKGHAGGGARVGLETGPMTPWLVHALRGRGLDVVCLDARHASAALKMQMNKTDQNDAEGLAQIMRTGWYRPRLHLPTRDETMPGEGVQRAMRLGQPDRLFGLHQLRDGRAGRQTPESDHADSRPLRSGLKTPTDAPGARARAANSFIKSKVAVTEACIVQPTAQAPAG